VKPASVAELIAEKYAADGPQVVADYSRLDFSKHVELLRAHMGLQPGSRVIDIGCGTGALVVELAQQGAVVTGVDTFEEAGGIDRRIVEARLRESGVAAEIVEASASSLPFADGAFDIAVSVGMLEHVPPEGRRRVLPEMLRVVRPGGHLFLIAGPTNLTPIDQHLPGHPLANWRSHDGKVALARRDARRQFLDVPWGISRRELRQALPQAEFRSLYAAYFAVPGRGGAGRPSLRPAALLGWLKRRFHLHALFGVAAAALYAVRQEHCHILAIRKPATGVATCAS